MYNNPSHCVSDATRGFTNFSGPGTATSETKAVICSPARNRSSLSSSIPNMRPAGTITWNFILVSHPAQPKLHRWSRHLAPERSCNHWHPGDKLSRPECPQVYPYAFLTRPATPLSRVEKYTYHCPDQAGEALVFQQCLNQLQLDYVHIKPFILIDFFIFKIVYYMYPVVQSGHTRPPIWYESCVPAGDTPATLAERFRAAVAAVFFALFTVRLAGRGALLLPAVLLAAAVLVLRIESTSCCRVLSVVLMLS